MTVVVDDEEFVVSIGDTRVPYLLGGQQAFIEKAARLRPDRWIIVSSEQPMLEHLTGKLAGQLSGTAPVTTVRLPDGEAAKSLACVERVCSEAFRVGASRASVLLAVGGGNVCNVGGLAASLMLRGIRLIQVPTTLIGMSDVVLSLKQGINLAGVKNGIGTYYAPELIWADPESLLTLPSKEIRAGEAEIVKNAFVISSEDLEPLGASLRPSASYSVQELLAFVKMAVRSKDQVLRGDGKERCGALVLEYGHTAGHALEAMSGGAISHGMGVGLGMRVAARVAGRLGLLPAADIALHDTLLNAVGLPLMLPREFSGLLDVDALAVQLLKDNKRGYLPAGANEVPMVLITSPGVPARTGALPLTVVPVSLVAEVMVDALG
ncbi:3-dehydroquinate synthase family protein [Sphaerisporangium fuscum]|uniref:3-dehydroquinate synthase family protein n=1 Tax=Sphaerisporangium fuscum TaxID=2835868 RepID=UPI001BDC7DE3|nr:iron-containing alcohol dehydrogenase [Sphaerisporangium fuscum]